MAIGCVALVLSWLMRMQLAFPGLLPFIDANAYYQFITMHGMMMVVYVLTALFLGGFGTYLIPLMVGARDLGFPSANRSEERRVGKEGGRTGRSRWSPYH